MNLGKLTTKEIEHKINQFQERSVTLKDIIKDTKDINAKKALQAHLTTYQDSINSLRQELEKRNK